jgi:hypothetical protein
VKSTFLKLYFFGAGKVALGHNLTREIIFFCIEHHLDPPQIQSKISVPPLKAKIQIVCKVGFMVFKRSVLVSTQQAVPTSDIVGPRY